MVRRLGIGGWGLCSQLQSCGVEVKMVEIVKRMKLVKVLSEHVTDMPP